LGIEKGLLFGSDFVFGKIQTSEMQYGGKKVNEEEANYRTIQVHDFINLDFDQSDHQTQTDKDRCINDFRNWYFPFFGFLEPENAE
jgi:hypothetical protein